MPTPLTRLDLNLLTVLEAVLELGSTKAAARRLGVTQPAVSYSLKKLREHFSEELFRRTQTGLEPTEFGKSLAEPLRRAMATIRSDILAAGPFSAVQTSRRFTISSSEIGELVLLPPLLDAFRELAPNASLNWVPIPPRGADAMMADGVIDLLISATLDEADQDKVYQQRLYTHEFVGLIRRDHTLLGDDRFGERLPELPTYIMSSSPATRADISARMRVAGFTLAQDLETTRLLSYPFLLQRADAFAVAPKAVATLAARFAPLIQFELPVELPKLEVKQFWHRRAHADPANLWLRGLVAKIFMNNDPTPEA